MIKFPKYFLSFFLAVLILCPYFPIYAKDTKLPILLYHYLEPIKTKDTLRAGMTVTPEEFTKQLKFIGESGYKTITMSEMSAKLESFSSKEKYVALTFDDGYLDFYEYAFPLLKKYQMKATIYVIYDAINAPGYLSEEMIKEMTSSGLVEIGSHALDHKKLTSLNIIEAKRQIFLSKELFAKRFKMPVITFAYPYGSFNQTISNLVKEAGYTAAISIMPGEIQSEKNRFYLSRLRPNNNFTSFKRLLIKTK